MTNRGRIRRGALTFAIAALAASGAFVETVDHASALTLSSTQLTTAIPNQVIGYPMTLKARVGGKGSPTGSVEFFEGATSLGTAQVVMRYAVLDALFDAGPHTVTAQYLGDALVGPSNSNAVTFVVGDPSHTKSVLQPHSVPASSSSTWTATTHLLFVGQVGILAGNLNYGPRTGTASITVDGTTQYTVPVVKNRVTLDFPNGIGIGAHTFAMRYLGDIHYLPSIATTRHVTITIP
jgi:hypothetical protein